MTVSVPPPSPLETSGVDPDRARVILARALVEAPFDPPMIGRRAIEEYWARVTAGQKHVGFTYEILACRGDEGVAKWHAAFTGVPGGEAIDLDGIFRLRFAEDGRVSSLEKWWHIRVVPPAEKA